MAFEAAELDEDSSPKQRRPLTIEIKALGALHGRPQPFGVPAQALSGRGSSQDKCECIYTWISLADKWPHCLTLFLAWPLDKALLCGPLFSVWRKNKTKRRDIVLFSLCASSLGLDCVTELCTRSLCNLATLLMTLCSHRLRAAERVDESALSLQDGGWLLCSPSLPSVGGERGRAVDPSSCCRAPLPAW